MDFSDKKTKGTEAQPSAEILLQLLIPTAPNQTETLHAACGRHDVMSQSERYAIQKM